MLSGNWKARVKWFGTRAFKANTLLNFNFQLFSLLRKSSATSISFRFHRKFELQISPNELFPFLMIYSARLWTFNALPSSLLLRVRRQKNFERLSESIKTFLLLILHSNTDKVIPTQARSPLTKKFYDEILWNTLKHIFPINFVPHFMTHWRSWIWSIKADYVKTNRADKHQKLLSGRREVETYWHEKSKSVHSPRIGTGNAVVRFTSSTFQRVTTIDDAFAGYWKMSKSVIFLFNTCVWHGSNPEERRKHNFHDWSNVLSGEEKEGKSRNVKIVSLQYLPWTLLRQAQLIGSSGSSRAGCLDWLWSGVVRWSISIRNEYKQQSIKTSSWALKIYWQKVLFSLIIN